MSMLTGRLPFAKVKRVSSKFLEELLASRRVALPDIRGINPAATRSVADIIGKLLAFDVNARYQTAGEVKEDLERHLADLPLRHAKESSRRARLVKFRRRHPRISTALAVGLVATLFLFLPAAVLTSLRGYSAYRLSQREYAEARLLLDDSRRHAFAIQTYVHSRSNDSRLFQISRERGEELARRYKIEASVNWDAQPEVSRLDEGERRELFDGMGDAFLALR